MGFTLAICSPADFSLQPLVVNGYWNWLSSLGKASKVEPLMAKPRNKPAEGRRPDGMWRAVSTVLVASMNKGLFVPACIFFLILVMLLKTPSEYFPTLWKSLGGYWMWGYILAIVTLSVWGMNVRYLRRVHHNEMTRISGEKTKLQEELQRRKLPSSGTG